MPLAQAARPDALGATRSGGAGAWRRSGAPVRSRAGRVPAGAASAVVTLVLGSSMPLADLVRPQRWELSWRAQPAQEALERSEEHTSELQSRGHLVCRLLLEKKKKCKGMRENN